MKKKKEIKRKEMFSPIWSSNITYIYILNTLMIGGNSHGNFKKM